MDSLTQIVLGAAVAEATIGHKVGRKAMLAGAILGSLPDLDVLIPFDGAVADFTYHRSFTHSVIVLTLFTPFIAWIFKRWMPKGGYDRWMFTVFMVLNTHVLLDCFTVYGTQALWPLTEHPVAWSTIFIIDPLYTVPLLLGVLFAMRRRRKSRSSSRANFWGLALSSVYLMWTVGAQAYSENLAHQSLNANNIRYDQIITTPTPMSLLWRHVAINDDEYYEGFNSLLDEDPAIEFVAYDRNGELGEPLAEHWPVQRLDWFTRGFNAFGTSGDGIDPDNADIVMTDLRMGIEASYVFNFKVAETIDGTITPMKSELIRFFPDTERVRAVFQRMFDESVSIDP